MSTKKIIGPAGTGKTTYLLKRVSEHLADGIKPDRIAYLAFTRKAAKEARERAPLQAEELPFFSTIHSLMYHLLEISSGEVMRHKHFLELGDWLGIDISGRMDDSTGMPIGDRLGDKCLRINHLARNRMISIEEQWETEGENLLLNDVKWFDGCLRKWKAEHGLIDFTGMLEEISKDALPDLDVLIVDEAQDLTPLQWKVVRMLAEGVEHVYIGGDDDQAIYSWSGADVDQLIDYEGEEIVLAKSYRLPRRVYDQAQIISGKISKRIHKDWHPRDDEGEVDFLFDIDDLDLSTGSWYLLARNRYLLKRFEEHTRDEGYLYTNDKGLSLDRDYLDAIRHWEQLRRGIAIAGADVAPILHLMVADVGYKKGKQRGLIREQSVNIDRLKSEFGLLTDGVWYEVLEKLGDDIEYLRAVLRNGEHLDAPRIHINTFHGVKGGEADNVAAVLDVSRATYNAAIEHPDDELRCLYVAATRAKERLIWIQPSSNFNDALMIS